MADGSLVLAEGQIARSLKLAEKALDSGKFENALAYGVLALAWQQERAEALRCLQGR